VPLILRLPNRIPAGVCVPDVVENLRIAPTILDLLGFPPLPTHQGDSLAGLALGRPEEERPAVSEFEDLILTLRTKDYRLVHNPRERHVPWINNFERCGRDGYIVLQYGRKELYDLRLDPCEQENIAGERPDVVRWLLFMLGEWRKKYKWDFGGKGKSFVDEALIEQLQSLGYLGTG